MRERKKKEERRGKENEKRKELADVADRINSNNIILIFSPSLDFGRTNLASCAVAAIFLLLVDHRRCRSRRPSPSPSRWSTVVVAIVVAVIIADRPLLLQSLQGQQNTLRPGSVLFATSTDWHARAGLSPIPASYLSKGYLCVLSYPDPGLSSLSPALSSSRRIPSAGVLSYPDPGLSSLSPASSAWRIPSANVPSSSSQDISLSSQLLIHRFSRLFQSADVEESNEYVAPPHIPVTLGSFLPPRPSNRHQKISRAKVNKDQTFWLESPKESFSSTNLSVNVLSIVWFK